MSQTNLVPLLVKDKTISSDLLVSTNQLVKHDVNVHKFGGSSLASTACIERVVNIIRQNCRLNDVVVVSANGKTTDTLFNLIELAKNASNELDPLVGIEQSDLVQALFELHSSQQSLINSLLKAKHAQGLFTLLAQDIAQLQVWLTQIANNKFSHYNDILAFGELWSAQLLSAVLNGYVCPSYYLDSRNFLHINNSRDCEVEYSRSSAQYQLLQQTHKLVVITGYIARDSGAETCTLGRNGSDYSATIMAEIAQANNVTLWTDVDGIYSADPRIVPNSRKLYRLPKQVAQELGRLGNPVLHAKTLNSLSTHKTHLHVASSFAPQTIGTEIGEFGLIAQQELSVTYLNDLLLVTSTSLQGEQGIKAHTLFLPICADHQQGFIVVELSQQKSISQWLARYNTEVIFKPAAIIATVGYQVVKRSNVITRFTQALKSNLLLPVVTTYGEGHSIIAVVGDNCTAELINKVHCEVIKEARQISLIVAGFINICQRLALKKIPVKIKGIIS